MGWKLEERLVSRSNGWPDSRSSHPSFDSDDGWAIVDISRRHAKWLFVTIESTISRPPTGRKEGWFWCVKSVVSKQFPTTTSFPFDGTTRTGFPLRTVPFRLARIWSKVRSEIPLVCHLMAVRESLSRRVMHCTNWQLNVVMELYDGGRSNWFPFPHFCFYLEPAVLCFVLSIYRREIRRALLLAEDGNRVEEAKPNQGRRFECREMSGFRPPQRSGNVCASC